MQHLFPSLAAALPAAVPLAAMSGDTERALNWVLLYLLTLTLEMPLVLAAWRFRGCVGSLRVWLVTCLVGNLISVPLVTLAAPMIGLPGAGISAMFRYMALETGVIALEAWAFRFRATTSWTEAVVIALVANSVTAVFGAWQMFSAGGQ